eukprot:SAG31_NODE_2212_length_6174_cov_11.856790_4_plen_55_part_00
MAEEVEGEGGARCEYVATVGRGLRDFARRELGMVCYFLVFVPTIREIRDFYREM